MIDISKADEISENGVLISTDADGVELIWIGGGAGEPSGIQAPIGSRYYQTNGKVWKKYSWCMEKNEAPSQSWIKL